MKSKIYELRADLLLLSVAIAWGVTFLMVQDAINSTPVYAFLFFRFALASILMFFIAYKFLKQTNKKTIRKPQIYRCRRDRDRFILG